MAFVTCLGIDRLVADSNELIVRSVNTHERNRVACLSSRNADTSATSLQVASNAVITSSGTSSTCVRFEAVSTSRSWLKERSFFTGYQNQPLGLCVSTPTTGRDRPVRILGASQAQDAPCVVARFVNSFESTGEPAQTPPRDPVGTVYLVGAGPGDPGLLTLKGKELLEVSDIVLYDQLVSPDILAMINPSATSISVGKTRNQHSRSQEQITDLLISYARTNKVVVRLKGGDPFVFGRGGEEMQGLVGAGIPVEVVPGITSGIAAPAYAGIPVTHREYSSSVTFVTGHEMVDKKRKPINWSALAKGSETIVVYMGMHNLEYIVEELIGAGCARDMPVALIQWGTWKDRQQELVATLNTVLHRVEEEGFAAPAIAVFGEVVHLRSVLSKHAVAASTLTDRR